MFTLEFLAAFGAALCMTIVVISGVVRTANWRTDRRRSQYLQAAGPCPPTKWVIKKRDGAWIVQIRHYFLDPNMLYYAEGPLEYYPHFRTYYAAPTLTAALDYINKNRAELAWRRYNDHRATLNPTEEEA